MSGDFITKDCWILGQLTGIRMMERELTSALKQPKTPKRDLRLRIAQLNSWLDQVDNALSCSRVSELDLAGNVHTLSRRGTSASAPAD
jgi:hypothetical protein